MNLWIGPEERQYVKVLQDFSKKLERDTKPTWMIVDGPQAAEVHHYVMKSNRRLAAYFHHVTCEECRRKQLSRAEHRWDHDRGEVKGLTVSLQAPAAGTGYWIDPRNGSVLGRFAADASERRTYAVPPFTVDLALLVLEDGAAGLDADGDGKPNDLDDDDDNDGVPDDQDAWPLEREEWADVDGDRIGDNMDADVDADGKGDDRNGNGTPDNEEADWDGDGVPNADAIPWDAFPRDPKEWRDTDGDGIGDNADSDDDGDGWSDEEELQGGTDPLNALSFP